MNNISQNRWRTISLCIIIIGWVYELLLMYSGRSSLLNFILPGVTIAKNLPVASAYIAVMGSLTFLMMFLLLRNSGESFAGIGFITANILKQIGMGAMFGTIIFMASTFVIDPLLRSLLPSWMVLHDPIKGLFTSVTNLVLLFFLAVCKGGFLEEMSRIFVLTRFEKKFDRSGLIFALVISTVLFGMGHAYQGGSAVIGIAIIGLCNAMVYLRKRSAWEAVSAHMIYDLWALLGGALMYYGK